MVGAKRILLIGRLKGCGILAMAEALPDDGRITLCATEPYLGVKSQEASDYSSHVKQISVKVGPTAATLEVNSLTIRYSLFVLPSHLGAPLC